MFLTHLSLTHTKKYSHEADDEALEYLPDTKNNNTVKMNGGMTIWRGLLCKLLAKDAEDRRHVFRMWQEEL